MGNYSPGTGIRKRLVILFLAISANLFSYQLEVLPDKPRVGRVLTLKVLTQIESNKEIEITKDLEYPEIFAKISGPILRTYRERVDGKYKRFHQVTWAFRINESGIYTLPEFRIKSEGVETSLEFPVIKTFLRDEIKNNFPLKVKWKDTKQEIYVGESLPIIIEAKNLEDIKFYDNLVSRKPRNGSFVEVQGLGGINQETIGEEDIYTVSIASWIYTPLEKGRVTIPSVRVDINGLTRYTGDLKINVLPLPKVNVTGGVGEFLINTSLDETQVTPEDIFRYKVKIQGMGNLPYFKLPDITHNGLIVLDKKESDNIDYGEKGYMGWREVQYTLQSLEPGVKEITIPSLSWIDWQGNSVYYNGATSNINVVSSKVVEEEIRPFLSLFSTPEIISSYRVYLYKLPFMWILLIISPLILFILAIVKKVKLAKSSKIVIISVAVSSLLLMSVVFSKGFEFQGELVKADNFIEEENYLEAINIYNNLAKELPFNYGLFLNLSILWDKLGDKAKSVYNVRMAERIYPFNKRIQQLKMYLSESEEYYQKQARTVTHFNPDLLFAVLVIFVNLLLYIYIKTRKNGNITTVSVLIFISIFTLSTAIGLIYVNNRNSIDSGVIVAGGSDVKKVPNSMALDWMTLPEGYTVYIKGEWEDKYLIETEYGLQGWLDKNRILSLESR